MNYVTVRGNNKLTIILRYSAMFIPRMEILPLQLTERAPNSPDSISASNQIPTIKCLNLQDLIKNKKRF